MNMTTKIPKDTTTKTLVQELKEVDEKIDGILVKIDNSVAKDTEEQAKNEGMGYALREVLDDLEPIIFHAEQKEAEDEKHRLTADELQIINLELGVGVSHVIRDKLHHWSMEAGR